MKRTNEFIHLDLWVCALCVCVCVGVLLLHVSVCGGSSDCAAASNVPPLPLVPFQRDCGWVGGGCVDVGGVRGKGKRKKQCSNTTKLYKRKTRRISTVCFFALWDSLSHSHKHTHKHTHRSPVCSLASNWGLSLFLSLFFSHFHAVSRSRMTSQ